MMIVAGLFALAAAAAPLTPTGKWTLDYRSDSCIASRQFGGDTAPTFLALEPILSPDMHKMRLSVLAPIAEGSSAKTGNAVVRLQPSNAVETVDYDSWLTKADGQRGYRMIIDTAGLAQFGETTELSIDTGKQSFVFTTGKLQTVLAAAGKCRDDLMRNWGIDPAALAEPLGNPGEWFSYHEYPAAALKKHAQGRVIVALTVNNDGKVRACRIAASSDDPDLDSGTCDVARAKARYVRKAGPDRFSVFIVRWSMNDG